MHVALLGGSFNPPHVGHLLAAHYVRAVEPVDEVWLMPAFRHPFGKPLVDFQTRLELCALLCEDTSGWMKPSAVEREVGGEGRTVDTVAFLRARYPEHRFSLIIGSDILRDLPHWKDVERLKALARFIVLHRAGYPAPEAVGPPLAEVSSTEVRRRLQAGEEPVGLVPRKVLGLIRARGLYSSDTPTS